MLSSVEVKRHSGFAQTEYLVLLTCIAIAAIAVLSLFGMQIKEGIARSTGSLDPTSLVSQSPTDDGTGSPAGSESGSTENLLPTTSTGDGTNPTETAGPARSPAGTGTDEPPEGQAAPANRLRGFQESVEAVFEDAGMNEFQKTTAIINEALRASENNPAAAHELVQDLRRQGWTSQDATKYNNPALVNSHYYFKGWMPGAAIGSLAMDVYDDGIKQYLGTGAADAVAEFWSGRNDDRPSSGYSPSTREWFERGVADKAEWQSKHSP
jgi:hypothetical protein